MTNLPVDRPVNPVVADWMRYLSGSVGRPDTTVRGAHGALGNLFRYAAAVVDVDPADPDLVHVIDLHLLQAWQQQLKRTARRNTVHTYTVQARGFFAWACSRAADKLLTDNPAAELPIPRPERRPADPIDDADLELALTTAAATDPQMLAMLVLAAGLGFRCQAIAQVRGSCVTWDDERREVFVSVVVKGAKPHTGKGGPSVYEALMPFRHASGPWFTLRRPGPGGKVRPADTAAVTRYINQHLRNLGIPKTAHKARKWAATKAYWQRRDVLATMAFLGHSSPVSVLPYVELVEGAGGDLGLAVDEHLAPLLPHTRRRGSGGRRKAVS